MKVPAGVVGALARSSRSLRVRLTVLTIAAVTLALALAGVLLVWRLRAGLVSGLDSSVEQRSQDVAAEALNGQLSAVRSTGSDSAIVVQVLDSHGRVISSSANVAGNPPLFNVSDARSTVHTVDTVSGGESGSYRLASVTIQTSTGAVTVFAAGSLAEIDASTEQLTAALLLGSPIAVLLLAGLAWALVGRALRHVETMRQAVSALSPEVIHRRIADDRAPTELRRLAETFDDLLDRVEHSVAQQRGLIADAAHELRTPVAAMLVRLESRRAGEVLPVHDVARLNADAARLAGLVEGLLSLARLDAGARMRHDEVDLDDLVVRASRDIASPRVDLRSVAAARVIGDGAALERVVRNLLNNAARHAESVIKVESTDDGRVVTLVVADDGPGIAPEDRERVFERFVRLDEARDRDSGGAGLGLAIAHDIVTRHQGTARFEDSEMGARCVVRLPSAAADSPFRQ